MLFYPYPEKQLKFIKTVFDITQESRILDVGCHSGLHVLELQKLSKYVFGIDIEKPEKDFPNFIHGDVFTSELPNSLDGVYLLAPFFGENWNNYEFLLSKINKCLKNGSKIIIDLYYYNDYGVGKGFQNFQIRLEKVILNNYIREEDNMLCRRTFLFKDWSQRNIELKWKVFNAGELEKIVDDTGFTIEGIYEDFEYGKTIDLTPKSEKTRRVVVLKKI